MDQSLLTIAVNKVLEDNFLHIKKRGPGLKNNKKK